MLSYYPNPRKGTETKERIKLITKETIESYYPIPRKGTETHIRRVPVSSRRNSRITRIPGAT